MVFEVEQIGSNVHRASRGTGLEVDGSPGGKHCGSGRARGFIGVIIDLRINAICLTSSIDGVVGYCICLTVVDKVLGSNSRRLILR